MKTFDLKSLIIGVLLTMMVVAFMLIATTNSTPVAWEYRVVEGYRGGNYQVYQHVINTAAQDGWEVVGVANDPEHPFAVMRKAKVLQRKSWWRFWK